MKTDNVFKRAYNDAIDLILKRQNGSLLPSESELCQQLSASRTTVRKVIAALAENGVVNCNGKMRTVIVSSDLAKRFPAAQTVSVAEQVEKRFMEWLLRDNTLPGTMIGELELARKFGVATTVIREFLNRFQHFGLIEKRPNAGWLFKGFTPSFALELFEIREMFELRSARAFVNLPPDAPQWSSLEAIHQEHLKLLNEIDGRFHDFSDLDSRFHSLINSAAPNRFIEGFYDLITLIFHYHYQWKKHDERQRNENAIKEHIVYIEALMGRNTQLVQKACRAHLSSAKITLMRSIED